MSISNIRSNTTHRSWHSDIIIFCFKDIEWFFSVTSLCRLEGTGKQPASEISRPGFESQSCCLLAVWAWESGLASLGLNFLICNKGELVHIILKALLVLSLGCSSLKDKATDTGPVVFHSGDVFRSTKVHPSPLWPTPVTPSQWGVDIYGFATQSWQYSLKQRNQTKCLSPHIPSSSVSQ